MRILKKLLIATAVLVLVVALAIVILGSLVPAERSFTNEIDINAPPDKVWQVLTDKKRYTEWQTQLERVEITDDQHWTEYPKDAPEPLSFQLEEDGRPSSMEFSYTMGSAIHGHWKGEMTSTPNGVRLRTTDGYKTNSWLMKLMLGVFFDLDKFAKDWNNKLKQRVETLGPQ